MSKLDKWAEVLGKLVDKLPFHKLDQVSVIVLCFAVLCVGAVLVAFRFLPPVLAFWTFLLTLLFLALMFLVLIISKRR